ncbi:MAG: hypothetical protein ACE5D0_01585 [Fidelibacterota bacterium]
MTNRILLFFFLLSISGLCAQKSGDVNEFLNKSILAIQNEDYDQALIYIERAKNIDDNSVEIYRLEAQLQEILGNNLEAMIAWENCLNLAQSDSLRKEAEVHINHLKE